MARHANALVQVRLGRPVLAADHLAYMKELGGFPIYNLPNREMFPSLRVLWVCSALILVSQIGLASDWAKPESALAEKIAAATGPRVIALDVANRSSISAADVDEIRRELIRSLASAGVQVWQPGQAATRIRVTLSQNLQEYVWVAEIQQATEDARVAMVSFPKPALGSEGTNASPLILRAVPLMARPEIILDAAFVRENPQQLLVLGENEITIYEWKDAGWVKAQGLPIPHSHPLPRDLRGRLILRRDHLFDAYLPGLVCHSRANSPLAMDCADSDDPWPLQTTDSGLSAFFSPVRNFFPGALVPGIGKQRSAPQFYSAAAIPKANYTLWIFTGTDGQIYLLDGINQQAMPKIHWGSDLAGVHVPCRSDWQVLVTFPENDTEDSLQAFEFPDHEPVAVSEKLLLKGSLTALWAANSGDSAIAIYRHADSGNYEADRINLACGQ